MQLLATHLLDYALQACVNKVLSHACSLLAGCWRSNSICFHWYHTDGLHSSKGFPVLSLVQGLWRPLQGTLCWVDFGRAPPHHSVYLQCRREEGLECSLAVTKHNLSCTRTRLLTKLHKHWHTSTSCSLPQPPLSIFYSHASMYR